MPVRIKSEISKLLRPATLQWREHALHEDGGFSECHQFDTEMCSHCAALPNKMNLRAI